MIGDIILIKIPKELNKYKKVIGDALLNSNKQIKVICAIEPVKGELRTRDIEIIAGEKRTETTHKEYGLTFKLDIKKCYFSPRLANERKRITNLVKKDEIWICGVSRKGAKISRTCPINDHLLDKSIPVNQRIFLAGLQYLFLYR